MDRDVQSGLNSINSTLQGVAKAKQAYDYSFEKQVEQESDRAYQSYQDVVRNTNDINKWHEAEQQYFAHMESYLNEINAPKTVRNRWNSELAPNIKNQIAGNRAENESRLYWNDSVAKWKAFVEQTQSNGDLDYEEKKAALSEYWNGSGLSDAPVSVVGKVANVDEALKSMQADSVTQYVDRYYADNPSTPSDFKASELAEEAVSYLESQGVRLDASTRSDYIALAINRINRQEQMEQLKVSEDQNRMTLEFFERTRTEGDISGEDIFAMALKYGAVNDDGTINKYWMSWFGNNLNILTAMADYEKVRSAVNKDNPQEEWENMMAGYGVSQGEIRAEAQAPGRETPVVSYSFVNDDGSLNWTNSSGKKTYSFSDGSSVTTEWGPRVEYALNNLGISRDSKEAVLAVVNLVNAEGAAGKYEDDNVVRMVNDLSISRANPKVTLAMYQNQVMDYIVNGWITQDDADKLGLWNPDTKYFQSSKIHEGVEKEVKFMVESAFPSKSDKDKKEKEGLWHDIETAILQELEKSYNANPTNFNVGSAQYEQELEKAFNKVVGGEIDKQVDKAIGVFLNRGIQDILRKVGAIFNPDYSLPASQRVEVQSLTRGFYNPDDINYDIFHYLTDDIQAKVNIALGQGYKKLDDMKNTAASVYDKKYSELSELEQRKIDTACLRVMYEQDVKNVISVAFGLDKNTMQKFYIEGIGPAYVDPDTNVFYATDSSPQTTSQYLTGTLTKAQLIDIQKKGSFASFTLDDLTSEDINKRVRRVGGTLTTKTSVFGGK